MRSAARRRWMQAILGGATVGMFTLTPAMAAPVPTTESGCAPVNIFVNTETPQKVQQYQVDGTAVNGLVDTFYDFGDIAMSADASKLYGVDYDDGDVVTFDPVTGVVGANHGLSGPGAGAGSYVALSALPGGLLLLGANGKNELWTLDPATGLTALFPLELPDGYSPGGDFLTLPDGDILALAYEEVVTETIESTLIRLHTGGTTTIIGTVTNSAGMTQSGGAVYLAGVDGWIRRLATVPTVASTAALTVTQVKDTGMVPLSGAASPQDGSPCAVFEVGVDDATVTVGATVTVTASGVPDNATGTITFTDNTTQAPFCTAVTLPALGCTFTAATVGANVIKATWSGGETATTTVTVSPPAAPTAAAKTSTGAGQAPQAVTVTKPAGGTVTLLDAGTPASTVTVNAAHGVYTLVASTGVITFTPKLGYTGQATAVHYRVTDAYSQSDDATYTPTVTAPPPPTAPNETTNGVGVAPQATTLPIPGGGTIALLDAEGNPTTELLIPAKGTYRLTLVAPSAAGVSAAASSTLSNPSGQPGNAVVTFTPVLGFVGTPPPIDYQVVDSYGQSTTATYTPTVTIPAAPAPATKTTTGDPGDQQTVTLTVPTGGSITLLGAGGAAVNQVQVPKQGTYVLNPATGVIGFSAVTGFSGQAGAVTYRVTDAYGQTADATYAAYVTGTAGLAVTGTAVLGMVGTGLVLIPAGAGLVALGRPRRRTAWSR